MSKRTITPALKAFSAAILTQIVFGQVQIGRVGGGFELRHIDDRERGAAVLELVAPADLRRWAQFAANGAFRPLKSAPNLRAGWRTVASDEEALGRCLDHLYPGAVADWYALRPGAETPQIVKITCYREFTNRQSGMYRITTMLDDAIASAMIAACCHRDFCLKQRLWTINGAFPAPDSAPEKSLIPCLEPCAILLEFARKVARLEQEEKRQAESQPGESALSASADAAPEPGNTGAQVAETDFDAPQNPRRARFILEKERMKSKRQ